MVKSGAHARQLYCQTEIRLFDESAMYTFPSYSAQPAGIDRLLPPVPAVPKVVSFVHDELAVSGRDQIEILLFSASAM